MKDIIKKEIAEPYDIKIADDNERTIIHYISTTTPDVYGDIVHPEGMDSTDFEKNPVVLFAHNSGALTVGKNIRLIKVKNGVIAKTKFADTEIGRELYRLNAEGYMNSWSIGFMIAEGGARMKDGYRHIDKWKLLEYSSVALPANPDALNLIVKNIRSDEFRKIFEENIKQTTIIKSPKKENKMDEKEKISEAAESAAEDEKMEKAIAKIMEPKLQKAIDEINKSLPGIPKENFISGENAADRGVQNGRNFLKSIVYRNPALMPAAYKDAANWLNEATAGEGGYLVPQEWYNRIMSNVQSASVVRRNATVIKAISKELLIPKLSTLPEFTFVNEGSAKSVSNPGFEQVKLARKDGGFIVLLSKQLIEDNAFDVMGFVSDMASKVISNAVDAAGFKGLGSIKGIMNSESGATPVILTGGLSGFNYDALINCIAAVPSESLPSAKWYMHRSTLAAIRKLRYGENLEYVLDSNDRRQSTIEGYPVELTDNCFDFESGSADNGILAFGDMKQMIYMEREGISMSVSDAATIDIGGTQINLWQQGLIGLNFGVSFDIKFVYPESMALVVTETSK